MLQARPHELFDRLFRLRFDSCVAKGPSLGTASYGLGAGEEVGYGYKTAGGEAFLMFFDGFSTSSAVSEGFTAGSKTRGRSGR